MFNFGGIADLSVDNSFLQMKYNNVDFSISTRVSSGGTTRVIGEKITSTSVTSYQITFTGFGNAICFGLIEIPDINSVTLDGGDYQTHWGPCADHFGGSMWPTGSIDYVCPCVACHAQCSKCSGPTENECEACSLGFYLQPNFPTCINSCPTGYWKDDDSNKCKICHNSCSVCTGPNNNQCSSCNSGAFLRPSSTTCASGCIPGYWGDTSSNTCVQCNTSCSGCTGPNNNQCSTCNSGYFLQPSGTGCLDSCPNGCWGNTDSHTCESCNTACSICTGPSDTQCSACNSGYFLQPAPDDTSCLTTCQTGYWKDTTNHVCTPCNAACEACLDGTHTQCSSCNSGFFLQPLPSTSTCLDFCPQGYWGNTGSHTCDTCSTACSGCTGASDTQCTDCNPGYFLQPAPSATTCLNSCPPGYWEDTTNHICALCDTSCAVCLDGTNTRCSSCNPGYFLQQGSTICLDSCPAGSWPNSRSSTCENCDISCAICSSSDNTQCSACNPGYFLQPSSTICLSTCPDHYYTNTSFNSCESKSNFLLDSL